VACETTYVFLRFFYVFFSKSKKHDFLRFFEWLTTFCRTLVVDSLFIITNVVVLVLCW